MSNYEKIPNNATPTETAILIVYHILGIKNTDNIRKFLHYRHRSSVTRVLRKHNLRRNKD